MLLFAVPRLQKYDNKTVDSPDINAALDEKTCLYIRNIRKTRHEYALIVDHNLCKKRNPQDSFDRISEFEVWSSWTGYVYNSLLILWGTTLSNRLRSSRTFFSELLEILKTSR